MNAIHPDRMTRAERLDEIARILAQGILRRRARMLDGEKSVASGLDLRREVRPYVHAVGAN